MNKHKSYYPILLFILVFTLACSALSSSTDTSVSTEPVSSIPLPSPLSTDSETSVEPVPGSTRVPEVTHLMIPSEVLPAPGKQVEDVYSFETATEKRAPYGDSYKLNRFERPFMQDMTYVPDLDIKAFNLSQDSNWYYITIRLIGDDPNNPIGINYGVEFDLDLNGFGDYLVWAHPPYTNQWDTSVVQVFKDTNQDTGGLSGIEADGNPGGSGYDSLIFDGGTGQNPDPDLAWVRISDSKSATVQFAAKKSLVGGSFMMGVIADAGLKDVSRFDYNDHFTEIEAGSPVRGKGNYPLGLLYAVDNTCWEAYGFQATGYEPKICPPILQPVIKPSNGEQPLACNPPPDCGGGPYDPNTCICLPPPP